MIWMIKEWGCAVHGLSDFLIIKFVIYNYNLHGTICWLEENNSLINRKRVIKTSGTDGFDLNLLPEIKTCAATHAFFSGNVNKIVGQKGINGICENMNPKHTREQIDFFL